MLLIFGRKTMLKEMIYFSCNNESEIEDILDDLITYTLPRNGKFYYDLYPETEKLEYLIEYIKRSKCNFRIITSENDVLLVIHNMSKLVNDGKVKILYMKDGHLIDTNN